MYVCILMGRNKKKNHVLAPCAVLFQTITYDNDGGFPLSKFFHDPSTHSMDIYWTLITYQELSICVYYLGKIDKEIGQYKACVRDC